MRIARRNRGAVLLMAVGLLTILAMLGTTFLIVANLNRKTASAFAGQGKAEAVARSVVSQVVADRLKDLYISETTSVYGEATSPQHTIDYPHDNVDPALSSFEPTGTTWPHLSNLPGDLSATDVSVISGALVDTDGLLNDGTNEEDALLWDSGMAASSGGNYYVALRLIDASSLMNANVVHKVAAAQAGVAMPRSNFSLEELVGTTIADSVHTAAGSIPFDMADMLALIGPPSASTATGRLKTKLAGQFDNSKFYLTSSSLARTVIPPPQMNDRVADKLNANLFAEVDIGDPDVFPAELDEPWRRFNYAIPSGISGLSTSLEEQRTTATQLLVNTIDFVDDDNDVTRLPTKGSATVDYVYGIERQPFITEVFHKVYKATGGVVTTYSAIELYNPYVSDLNMSGFNVTVGGATASPTAGKSWPADIQAGRRVVIVSDASAIPVHTDAQATVEITGLDLGSQVLIFRSRNGDGTGTQDIVIGQAELSVDEPSEGNANCEVRQWDDTLEKARYTLPNAYNSFTSRDYTNVNGGSMTAGNTNLGKDQSSAGQPGNDNIGTRSEKPCPVYVRNGKFLNLADLARVFYFGPSNVASLRSKLTASASVANGRFSAAGGGISIPGGGWSSYRNLYMPSVPLGCIQGQYLTVDDPAGGGNVVAGLGNINTMPTGVLACVPGLTNYEDSNPTYSLDRSTVVKEVIAYRDRASNTAYGGADYSSSRAAATGISNLRNGPGFAAIGEITIPTWARGSQGDIGRYALGHYYYPGTRPPDIYNYALGGNDDDGYDKSLGANRVKLDLAKRHTWYAWASNNITVRSDTYIAYIRVQVGSDPATQDYQRYVAVIDRSNCTQTTDRPTVLMFCRLP